MAKGASGAQHPSSQAAYYFVCLLAYRTRSYSYEDSDSDSDEAAGKIPLSKKQVTTKLHQPIEKVYCARVRKARYRL